jgi:hypothetical protein
MALVHGSKNKCCSSVVCSSSAQSFLLCVCLLCFQVFMKLGPETWEEIVDLKHGMVLF